MSWRFARSDNDVAMVWYTNSLVYKITLEWLMYIRIHDTIKSSPFGGSYISTQKP